MVPDIKMVPCQAENGKKNPPHPKQVKRNSKSSKSSKKVISTKFGAVSFCPTLASSPHRESRARFPDNFHYTPNLDRPENQTYAIFASDPRRVADAEEMVITQTP